MEGYVADRSDALTVCHTAALCHDDYHEGNVLVSTRGGRYRVSGIVDVENAVAADPLIDLAKTSVYAARNDPPKWTGLLRGYGDLGDLAGQRRGSLAQLSQPRRDRLGLSGLAASDHGSGLRATAAQAERAATAGRARGAPGRTACRGGQPPARPLL